jgi:hypothetical protein
MNKNRNTDGLNDAEMRAEFIIAQNATTVTFPGSIAAKERIV